jgi:alpha-glucosidase
MTRWQDVNGIYQIYPRSFRDANGDGIGDLAGIVEKLGYIKGDKNSLGIDAIWISPFFKSPMADFGYDVADYRRVDPIFGTNEDFGLLLKEAHRRDIKVMIDYVPNHTSDQHEWFLESKEGRDSEKRSWYVWRDPKPDGSPPSNWLSVFGGSAWEFDEKSGQYYLHSFLKEQPDLNWDNPDVRKAMTDVLDFWLSMGVDGIRADAVRWLSKDLMLLEDNPPNPDYRKGEDPYHQQLQRYSSYGKYLFDYLKEIAATIEAYPDRIILFEDHPDTRLDVNEQYAAFYAVNPVVAAPFNFEGLETDYGAKNFRTFIDNFQRMTGSNLRPFYCFGNHDEPRLASRFGMAQARLVGLLQLSLPGIPVVYYGEELGMENVIIARGQVRDLFEKHVPGLGLGRDPQRTPMQWTGDIGAGFTTGKPWLPVARDFTTRNVASETLAPHSSLTMYRRLLELRRSAIFEEGSYVEWEGNDDAIFGFSRENEDDKLLILLNMSDHPTICRQEINGEVIYSTHVAVEFEGGRHLLLKPNQGVIVRLPKG